MTSMRKVVAQRQSIHRSERGETLLETLLTVFLMGTVLLTLIMATVTVVRAANLNRKVVRSGNGSVEVVEAIELASYRACGVGDPLTFYQDHMGFDLSGYEARIIGVRYLKDRGAVTPPDGESFQESCPVGGDQGSQELTIELRTTRSPYLEETLVYYKRDAECPTQNQEFEGQQC